MGGTDGGDRSKERRAQEGSQLVEHFGQAPEGVPARQARVPAPRKSTMKVLVVDVGGTHVKVLVSGQTLSRKFDSGPGLTPRRMVSGVKKIAGDWAYDAVS